MKWLKFAFIACVMWMPGYVLAAEIAANSYASTAEGKQFIDRMVAEHKFDRQELEAIFSDAYKQQKIIDAISKPAEKTLVWHEYRKIFLTDSRIEKGVEFWRQYAPVLQRASKEFGVPEEIIVAIIGVETHYGKWKGRYRVIDALSTLSFDYPPRSKFFTGQLVEYLLLLKEQGLSAKELMGSYAGAMGYGQFIPSSYRAYAVDYDGDNIANIIDKPVDAIGSVANYFARHGWIAGGPVIHKLLVKDSFDETILNQGLKPSVMVKDLAAAGYYLDQELPAESKISPMRFKNVSGNEYWLGHKNFYVITRYNHSRLYAMAVFQLSEALRYAYSDNKKDQ